MLLPRPLGCGRGCWQLDAPQDGSVGQSHWLCRSEGSLSRWVTSPPCFSPSQVSQLQFSLQLQEWTKIFVKMKPEVLLLFTVLLLLPSLNLETDIKTDIFCWLDLEVKTFNIKLGLITWVHYSSVLSASGTLHLWSTYSWKQTWVIGAQQPLSYSSCPA